MKKLASTLPNMVLSLGVITILSAVLLAWVDNVTAGPIALAAQQKKIQAIQSVAPTFDNNPIDDSWEWSPSQSARPYSVYPAFKDGKLVGAAVEAYSLNGFSGEVRVMYGFGASGDVTGYEVLSHAETPGLGARMNEWFRSDEGNRSVIGHNPGSENMTVVKDGGIIDAITAATISSRAFLESARGAYDAFVAYKEYKNE